MEKFVRVKYCGCPGFWASASLKVCFGHATPTFQPLGPLFSGLYFVEISGYTKSIRFLHAYWFMEEPARVDA